jgi:hypothetical protein
MPNSLERIDSPHVFTVSPMLEKFFSNGESMDNATYHKITSSKLGKRLQTEGLMHTFWSNPDYSFVMYPKTIPTVPYEALLTLLPNTDTDLGVSTVDQIDAPILTALLNHADRTRRITRNVAEQDEYKPTKTVIFQHVGSHDMTPKTSFNTSYKPLHFHVQVYGYPLEDFSMFEASDSIDPQSEENRSVFKDPGMEIASDILKHEGFNITPYGRYSCVLDKKGINAPFTDDDSILIQQLHKIWNRHWQEFANALTDFSLDGNERYVPHSLAERSRLMSQLLSDKYSYLGDSAKKRLGELASNLKAATDNPWEWIYKGPNGSFGYVFDHTARTRELVFSPRLFTSWYRHYDLVGENIIIQKIGKCGPQGKIHHESHKLLNIQKRMITQLQRQADNNISEDCENIRDIKSSS